MTFLYETWRDLNIFWTEHSKTFELWMEMNPDAVRVACCSAIVGRDSVGVLWERYAAIAGRQLSSQQADRLSQWTWESSTFQQRWGRG